MATPTKSAFFDGYRLVTLRQSLCSLHDQVTTLNASESAQQELKQSTAILTDWLSTHFEGHMNPESTAPDIWGMQGWERMQDLLSELSSKIETIQAELQPIPKAEERSEETERESLHIPVILRLVTELHQSLEMLMICSEIRFRMHHPETSFIRPALEDAVQARRGAYILYDAIQAKEIQCDLNIDLFSGNPVSVIKVQEPALESKFHQRICYQLIFKDSARNDLRLQEVNHRRDLHNTAGLKTREDATSLFEPLQPHCIQRGPFDRRTYFHVFNGTNHSSAGSPSSEYLKACPPHMKEEHWKHSKLVLAYQLSECALNLMGTPFLAQLSTEAISVNRDETNTIFTLALPRISAEELYRQNPRFLTESDQLLCLGMVLIEIALGPLKNYKTKAWPRNRCSYAAELLPHVRSTMGTTYQKICAFFVEEWMFKDDYKQPDKWDGAEESGWNLWLRDFLRVYDSFVVQGLRNLLGSSTP